MKKLQLNSDDSAVFESELEPIYSTDAEFSVRIVMPTKRSIDIARSFVSISKPGVLGSEITIPIAKLRWLDKRVEEIARGIINERFGKSRG